MSSIPASFPSTSSHRRFKGKQKATESSDVHLQLEQTELCQQWLGSLRQTLQCQAQHQTLMLEEFLLPPQSLPGMAFQHNPPIQRIHPFTNHVPIQQRRHASNAFSRKPATGVDSSFPSSSSSPDSKSSSTLSSRAFGTQFQRASPSAEHAPVELFRHHVHVSPDQFNLTACRTAFDAACRTQTPQIYPPDVQLYAQRIVHGAEKFYARKSNPEHMKDWGLAATHALLLWETALRTNEKTAEEYEYILARALALSGQLRRATRMLHDILSQKQESDTHKVLLYGVYESIIHSTNLHYGSGHVLNFAVLEWSVLQPCFSHRPQASTGPLQQSVFTALQALPQPVAALKERSTWEQGRMQNAVDLLLTMFIRTGQPAKALQIYEAAPDLECRIATNDVLLLVRALAKDGAFDAGQQLYGQLMENKRKYYLATGLDLYGRMGDHSRAEYFFRALSTNGTVSQADRNSLLFSYAKQGNVEKTEETFERLFPLWSDASDARENHPDGFAHATVMYAHARRGDLEATRRWFAILQKACPTIEMRGHHLALEAFSMCGDIESTVQILKDMRRSHHAKPNAKSYTYLVSMLAHRGDPEGAERVYSRAVRDGVVPDRHLVTTLMNAHVEAGSWHGVIRAFDYMSSTQNSKAYLSIEVFNTLLKAYVMIGSPFKTVSRVYDRLQSSYAQPDQYTFALLVQSACDAGYMNIAEAICQDVMDGMYENVALNTYLLTILMAGYIRRGVKQKATETYDRFAKLGIYPSSVTFNHVIRAYANERSEESLQVAEGFVSQLLDTPKESRTWQQPPRGKKGFGEHLYGPVLAQYAREEELTGETERVFQDMLDRGIKPTLGPLTSLLNAYRKLMDTASIVELWPRIFEIGLQKLNALSEEEYPSEHIDPESRVKPDLLSVPLSIYIDALSSAGKHMEVAQVWRQFQENGLRFTSHNWNHLTVALIRAGEAERAFEVLEKVIIPYQRQAEQLESGRDFQPQSPLSLQNPDAQGSLPPPPGLGDDTAVTPPETVPIKDHGIRAQSPLHNPKARKGAVYMSTKKMETPSVQEREEERPNDHAHSLHILHDVSPSWNVWRPHLTTLSVLLVAMIKLRAGSLVKAISPEYEDDVSEAEQEAEGTEEDQSVAADQVLARIREEYPNAFSYVLEHEVREKKRLKKRFEFTYRP